MKKPIKPFHLLAVISLLVILAFGITGTVQAFESDHDGHVPEDAVIDDDLVISGDIVTIDGTVNGNVFASGRIITLNGTVNGNLLINSNEANIYGPVNGSLAVASKSAIIESTIDGTVYYAGGSLVLGSEAIIERNILFTGYSLETTAGAIVRRDITGNGYQFIHRGEIEQELNFDTAAIEIDGQIGEDVDLIVAAPNQSEDMSWIDMVEQFAGGRELPAAIATGIRVSDNAQISGKLNYSSPQDQTDAITARPDGGVTFTEISSTNDPAQDMQFGSGLWIARRMREFLTLLALGALTLWKAPTLIQTSSQKLAERPLPALWAGILSYLGGYAAIVLLAILILILGMLLTVVTMGGMARTIFGVGFSSWGVVFSLFLLTITYGSKLVVTYFGGEWIVAHLAPNSERKAAWALISGLGLFFLMRLIPFLGAFIGIAATLMGLGAIWLVYKDWHDARRASQEA
jgi:cytoskeletal protein CcmA (bactofilin family)